MLCLFCWGGLGVGWEAVPGKPEGQRVSGCIARTLCPLLKPLLLPAAPPSARSFACDTKPWGFLCRRMSAHWGCGDRQHPGRPLVGGRSPQALSGRCACVCLCLHGLCCAFWSWGLFLPLYLPGFMPLVPGATAKALQTPWAQSEASPSQAGIQGPAVKLWCWS